MNEEKLKKAFKSIKEVMAEDDQSQPGSYARILHNNIAMCCYESIDSFYLDSDERMAIGNEAARKFMKIFFDVETWGGLILKFLINRCYIFFKLI